MNASFFTENRTKLMKALDGGLIVLSAHTGLQRSSDSAHSFVQESNFWYLTGVEEPDWLLIIDGQRGRSTLVAPEISTQKQTFDGSLPWDDAKKISGVDDVISANDADIFLRDLAKKHSLVYSLGDEPHAKYYEFVVNPAQKKVWQKLERIFPDVVDCRKELAQLRAIKQPEEIRAIKRAVKLTSAAFSHVRENLSEFKYEYEIEAEFDYMFARHNSSHAYDPIVASGAHACTLHYVKNDARLKPHQGILLDLGARVDGYAADITRTYVNGEPSKRFGEVHKAVESAHKQIIASIKPKGSVEEYQRTVEQIMENALVSLGVMKPGEEDKLRQYFPHAVSHGLGVDVHDSLGAPRFFEPGMVLTVEPGIYIQKEGIGVRIEDDILVTEKGISNLSASLPTGL